jgi:hypothetical protein
LGILDPQAPPSCGIDRSSHQLPSASYPSPQSTSQLLDHVSAGELGSAEGREELAVPGMSGLEDGWNVSEGFIVGRPVFYGHQDVWNVPEEFIPGRPLVYDPQRVTSAEDVWNVPGEFIPGRPLVYDSTVTVVGQ